MEKHKEFDIVTGHLLYAYKQFLVAKELSFVAIADTFRTNVMFWDTVRLSLTRGYLSELAKLFEKKEQKVMSIPYLLGNDIMKRFDSHDGTIQKLRTMRNKFLMHSDLETIRGLEQFIKELDLKPIDHIEALFLHSIEVLKEAGPMFQLSGDPTLLFREAEQGIKGDVKNLVAKIEIGMNSVHPQ